MTEELAALLIVAMALPHLLPLERATPTLAATVWATALALRALTVLYVALYLVLFLPQTELFSALTHWCWETVLPLLATHLGLDGSRVGISAIVLAAAVVAASATSVSWGVVQAARSVRTALRRATLGTGPRDSLLVGGPTVFLAASGIAHPRVIVSAGALTVLDDDELAAGLDHERAHIERRHRFVLVFAELCRGLARFLPGTHHAARELRFQLERDADRWALARRHEPHALVGAICKATASFSSDRPRVASLGGRDASRRVDELLTSGARRPGRRLTASLLGTAVLLGCLALVLAAAVPVTAIAGVQQANEPAHRHCEH